MKKYSCSNLVLSIMHYKYYMFTSLIISNNEVNIPDGTYMKQLPHSLLNIKHSMNIFIC
jgi:hypothetical protein